MSTDCQKTTAKAIPSIRRVTINDAEHMPHDYSTTPGGTLFSTTPGGTQCCYLSYSFKSAEEICSDSRTHMTCTLIHFGAVLSVCSLG